MTDHSITVIDSNETALADREAAELTADFEEWKKFLAEEDPPALETPSLHGDGIAFSTRGYATDEEADAALEAFLMKAFGLSDDEEA